MGRCAPVSDANDNVQAHRGTDSQKVVGRSRFSPALLKALSLFTVEPKSGWVRGAEISPDCAAPLAAAETERCWGGPAWVLACNAQNPKAAAKRDIAAITATADWRRVHCEALPAPRKVTVLATVTAWLCGRPAGPLRNCLKIAHIRL